MIIKTKQPNIKEIRRERIDPSAIYRPRTCSFLPQILIIMQTIDTQMNKLENRHPMEPNPALARLTYKYRPSQHNNDDNNDNDNDVGCGVHPRPWPTAHTRSTGPLL